VGSLHYQVGLEARLLGRQLGRLGLILAKRGLKKAAK
jgi:hypothetical protein